MAILVTVAAKAKPDSVDTLKEILAETLPGARTYDGNLGIIAYLNEDGQSFLLVENWESKAQYEKYLGWRQETGTLDRIVAILEGPPDIRYFEALDA